MLTRLRVTTISALWLATALATSSPAAGSGLVWPDVPDRIERGLASPDPATRRVAARDLASLGGGRAAPLVLTAMHDGDVDVRLAAAQSAVRLRVAAATEVAITWLGERETRLRISACEVAHALPSPKAVQPIARALGDADPQVRLACAEALGATGSGEAIAPLAGKLDDSTPNVRVQVARSLARIGDARAVVPLVGKVQDSVPDVRQAVVRALGDLGDPRATQALLLALRDNVAEVRIEALSALGRLRAPEAVDAIAPLALERNLGVRQSALVALGRIGTPAAVKALTKALGTNEDASGNLDHTSVRDALVSAGQPAVVELTALLDRPISSAIATSAAWVLGELHANSSAPAIVAALRKGTLPPAAALHALAGCGSAEQVPVVLEYVADPTPQAREEALRAATALLDPSKPDGRAVEPLAATLNNPRTSPRERASVATLLGRTGAPRAATELVGLVNAKDAELRLAAIDALGALGGAAAVQDQADDVLVPLLTDTDPAVRLHTAVALAASGGLKARKLLLAKMDGDDELDRYALFTALGGVLERHPDDAAAKRVFRELAVAAGPERDAVIDAAGRAKLPSVVAGLDSAAKTSDIDDRRSIAAVVGGQPQGAGLAHSLAQDADASVRADAVWSLGQVADAREIPFLVGLMKSGDADVATNAAAAIGRIARRVNATTEALCGALADGRATVRANALAGLKARCGDGRTERALLADDPSELVRAAAARAVTALPLPDDRAAVDRCAVADRSAEVARLCRPRAAKPVLPTHAVTVFVVGESEHSRDAAIHPRTPFLLEYEDGLLRAGTADRRGATFDPAAPDGLLTLRRVTGN